jgi:hypothetical protein
MEVTARDSNPTKTGFAGRRWQTQQTYPLGLPNQCLTNLSPSMTFLSVMYVKNALILGNLLISGLCFQNPAYRPVRQFS